MHCHLHIHHSQPEVAHSHVARVVHEIYRRAANHVTVGARLPHKARQVIAPGGGVPGGGDRGRK